MTATKFILRTNLDNFEGNIIVIITFCSCQQSCGQDNLRRCSKMWILIKPKNGSHDFYHLANVTVTNADCCSSSNEGTIIYYSPVLLHSTLSCVGLFDHKWLDCWVWIRWWYCQYSLWWWLHWTISTHILDQNEKICISVKYTSHLPPRNV